MHDALHAWRQVAGSLYGSEDSAQLLYALVKMQRDEHIVELGTGLGATAFWLAQAVLENGAGHVYSVDDGRQWDTLIAPVVRSTWSDEGKPAARVRMAAILREGLARDPSARALFEADDYPSFLTRAAEALGLASAVTFLHGTLLEPGPVEDIPRRPFLAPALSRPIDLLFSDFGHDPMRILAVLGAFLPHMAESSSIFIDSAPTLLASHLVLERVVDLFAQGKVPAMLLAGASPTRREALLSFAATRTVRLLPIVERKSRSQNGLAWLKIEPAGVLPSPLTRMRGVARTHHDAHDHAVEADDLAAFFERGEL